MHVCVCVCVCVCACVSVCLLSVNLDSSWVDMLCDLSEVQTTTKEVMLGWCDTDQKKTKNKKQKTKNKKNKKTKQTNKQKNIF